MASSSDDNIEKLPFPTYPWIYLLCLGNLGNHVDVCPIHQPAGPSMVLTLLCSTNTEALVTGGLSGLFWSMCWCYIGQMFVVLSLAEMAASK